MDEVPLDSPWWPYLDFVAGLPTPEGWEIPDGPMPAVIRKYANNIIAITMGYGPNYWLDRGTLDLGIEREPFHATNDLQLFSESWLALVELDPDAAYFIQGAMMLHPPFDWESDEDFATPKLPGVAAW